MLLAGESEVQLGDLAGNAMSLPVVCAAQLALLVAQEYALRKADDSKYYLQLKSDAEAEDGVLMDVEAGAHTDTPAAAGDACKELLVTMASLSHDAMVSSILCVCETSGGVSEAGIMVCQDR